MMKQNFIFASMLTSEIHFHFPTGKAGVCA
jgi:hypothetical protein